MASKRMLLNFQRGGITSLSLMPFFSTSQSIFSAFQFCAGMKHLRHLHISSESSYRAEKPQKTQILTLPSSLVSLSIHELRLPTALIQNLLIPSLTVLSLPETAEYIQAVGPEQKLPNLTALTFTSVQGSEDLYPTVHYLPPTLTHFSSSSVLPSPETNFLSLLSFVVKQPMLSREAALTKLLEKLPPSLTRLEVPIGLEPPALTRWPNLLFLRTRREYWSSFDHWALRMPKSIRQIRFNAAYARDLEYGIALLREKDLKSFSGEKHLALESYLSPTILHRLTPSITSISISSIEINDPDTLLREIGEAKEWNASLMPPIVTLDTLAPPAGLNIIRDPNKLFCETLPIDRVLPDSITHLKLILPSAFEEPRMRLPMSLTCLTITTPTAICQPDFPISTWDETPNLTELNVTVKAFDLEYLPPTVTKICARALIMYFGEKNGKNPLTQLTSIQTSEIKNFDLSKHCSLLSNSLETLSMVEKFPSFMAIELSRKLTTLHLGYGGETQLGADQFEFMPPNLTCLRTRSQADLHSEHLKLLPHTLLTFEWANKNKFSVAQAAALPRGLTQLNLAQVQTIDEKIFAALPRSLTSLMLSQASNFEPEVKTLSPREPNFEFHALPSTLVTLDLGSMPSIGGDVGIAQIASSLRQLNILNIKRVDLSPAPLKRILALSFIRNLNTSSNIPPLEARWVARVSSALRNKKLTGWSAIPTGEAWETPPED